MRANRSKESETVALDSLTEDELDRLEKNGFFEDQAREVEKAERRREPTLSHQELMRRVRRNRR
jgi:hypothetical protein